MSAHRSSVDLVILSTSIWLGMASVSSAAFSPPEQVSGDMVVFGDAQVGSTGSALQVISDDDRHLVYLADQDTDGTTELYSVDLDGGSSVRLNGSLARGGNVRQFQISPDSRSVVYRADQDTDGVNELLGVPLGGGEPVRLNNPLPFSADVDDFLVSSDGQRVIYRADQAVAGQALLYVSRLPEDRSDNFCFPIRTSAGDLAIICL